MNIQKEKISSNGRPTSRTITNVRTIRFAGTRVKYGDNCGGKKIGLRVKEQFHWQKILYKKRIR